MLRYLLSLRHWGQLAQTGTWESISFTFSAAVELAYRDPSFSLG